MTRNSWIGVVCGCVQFTVFGAEAAAQITPRQGIDCDGLRISRIDIEAKPPFEVRGGTLVRQAALIATRLHVTTNPEVIRRFLALRAGDECTEIRRSESERILRAQPYLAEAYVRAFPDGAGLVRIEVTTVDEISLLGDVSVSGKSPALRALRLGEANLLGEAVYLSAEWRHDRFFRDHYGVRVTDYQFMGRPYQLSGRYVQRPLGAEWSFEASHPFLTDLQRISWRTTAGVIDNYRHFRRVAAPSAALKFKRSFADIGGVVRMGEPFRMVLLGGSVSNEKEMTSAMPVTIQGSQILRDTSTALINRYSNLTSTRINALFGVRNVRFMQASGFETLEAPQDIRKGIQIGTLVGKAVPVFGSDDDDALFSGDVFMGAGSPRFYGALEFATEARHNADRAEYDGVLTTGRAALYWKPQRRHTIAPSLEWSAGWRQRVPFQLTFADREGGMRGYRDSDIAGGKRLVARFEDRYVLGRLRQFATVGVGAFADAGVMWAGDAPFGQNSGARGSVGLSLLAAVPPRSQRLWRLDVAAPVRGGPGSGWEVRLTSRNMTRMFWREPGDVRASRERAIPSSIFNWP